MHTCKIRVTALSAIALWIGVIASCTHDPLVLSGEQPIIPGDDSSVLSEGIPCDPDTSYFVNDVLPIFVGNCAISGCHDNETHQKDVILSTYAQIMASDVLKPGDASNSDIIELISETDVDDRMPPVPANPLSDKEIAILTQWIEQGALNNNCGEICDTSNVTWSVSIEPVINSYCTGCHKATSPAAGLDLTTYEGVAAVAAVGKLSGVLNHEPGYPAMPKGSDKLSECKLAKIEIWIENGYPNN